MKANETTQQFETSKKTVLVDVEAEKRKEESYTANPISSEYHH